MRPKLTELAWSGGSLLLAVLFLAWAGFLLFTMSQRQIDVAQVIACALALISSVLLAIKQRAVRNLRDAEGALQQARADLERRVEERTQALEHEVDEHKQVEEAIRASERRFQALLEHGCDVILLLAPDGTILFNAPQQGHVLGYVNEDFLGCQALDLIHPDDQSSVRATLTQVLNRTLPLSAQFRARHQDGGWRWMEGSVTNLLAEPSVGALVVNYRDISARKQAEEALRASEEQFRAIFELAATGIVQVDPRTGRFLRVNQAFCTLTGYTSEELHERTFADITHPEDRAVDLAKFQRMIQGAIPAYMVEKRYLRKEGQVVWVQVNAKLVRDTAGRPDRTIGVINDVTDRKVAEEVLRQAHDELERKVRERTAELTTANSALQAEIEEHCRTEDALRDSEALYHSLVEHLPMSVYRKDQQGRIVFANRQWCEVRRLPLENLLGKTVFDLFPQPLASKYSADDLHVLRTGKVFRDVEEHATGTGERIWVEVVKTALRDHRGKIVGIQGAFWDVTARRRAEEALKQAHEELERRVVERTAELALSNAGLARSNAELQQFAYVASHDLQEPLRAVAGCVTLLRQHYGDQLDARAAECMAHAVDGATRMQALIGDLLAFSRVGTHGRTFEATDCNAIVESVLADLQVAIREGNAQVTCGPLPTLPADRTQLAQLFQNLLSNAVKFRGVGPPAIRVVAGAEDGVWHFTVADNGIGIEPKYFDRIFRVFQRLHTRRAFPGTGIGLAICKKIVERHGGRIWVESIPGQGTTFHFLLPDRT